MSYFQFPFAIRLIGFSEQDLENFDAAFATRQGKAYGYFRLAEDNLQDPDIYVANADDLKALIFLSDLRPCGVRPALLVGKSKVDLPYARVARPLQWPEFFAALDELVEKRADALASLEASDVVIVPERRRRPRLNLDLTNPAEYEKMRAKIPENGAVLVVDKSPALCDYLADLLARQKVTVAWVINEVQAVEFCKKQTVAVVMINTSTPDVDPYRLCWALKEKDAPYKISVIFLVSKPFEYDQEQARFVGVEGFLNKPLSSQHLVTVLKKFLPSAR